MPFAPFQPNVLLARHRGKSQKPEKICENLGLSPSAYADLRSGGGCDTCDVFLERSDRLQSEFHLQSLLCKSSLLFGHPSTWNCGSIPCLVGSDSTNKHCCKKDISERKKAHKLLIHEVFFCRHPTPVFLRDILGLSRKANRTKEFMFMCPSLA